MVFRRELVYTSVPHTKREVESLPLHGGDKGIRTPGLCVANASLYQLSHTPVFISGVNIFTRNDNIIKLFLSNVNVFYFVVKNYFILKTTFIRNFLLKHFLKGVNI